VAAGRKATGHKTNVLSEKQRRGVTLKSKGAALFFRAKGVKIATERSVKPKTGKRKKSDRGSLKEGTEPGGEKRRRHGPGDSGRGNGKMKGG